MSEKRMELIFKEKGIPIWTIILFSIGISLIGLGVSSNFIVISENQGKMPVFEEVTYSTDKHFSTNNLSEINKPHLADIYHIKGMIYSIGDILMITGLILFYLSILIMFTNDIIKTINYFKK